MKPLTPPDSHHLQAAEGWYKGGKSQDGGGVEEKAAAAHSVFGSAGLFCFNVKDGYGWDASDSNSAHVFSKNRRHCANSGEELSQ